MQTLSSHHINTQKQSFWRRRAYERLEGTSAKKRTTARLGGGKKRGGRVKVLVKILSPKKLLVSLRDAYVNAMLVFGGDTPSTKKIAKVRDTGGTDRKLGDFETRMILQIYNSVMSNPRELMMIRARAERSAEVDN